MTILVALLELFLELMWRICFFAGTAGLHAAYALPEGTPMWVRMGVMLWAYYNVFCVCISPVLVAARISADKKRGKQ